jgi:PEP-CTERM motif
MRSINILMSAAFTVAAAVTPTSASAVVTTFATVTTDSRSSNTLWTQAGSGGTLVSTSTDTATSSGVAAVRFTFINTPALAAISNISALFQINAGAPAGNPASSSGAFLVQGGLNGSFSFINTSVIVVGSTVFAAGSNLLSGTFSGGTITGLTNGKAAQLTGASIAYTSDFIDLTGVTSSSFAISLDNATPSINATTGNALDGFRARASGAFSADGLTVSAVPEPDSWMMMIVGFGLAGTMLRRPRLAAAMTA